MGKLVEENGIIWLVEITENYGSKSIKKTLIEKKENKIEENEKPKRVKRKRTT